MGANGGGAGLGDIAGLGVTLGAMGGVMGLTRDAMSPLFQQEAPNQAAQTGWNCACGAADIQSKFCPECGAKMPSQTWDCPGCGEKNIHTKFCPECGHKKEG